MPNLEAAASIREKYWRGKSTRATSLPSGSINMHVTVLTGQPAFSSAALAINIRMPSPVGAAARFSAAYSVALRSIPSSDTPPSWSWKSTMDGDRDVGRTFPRLCEVFGCEGAADVPLLLTDLGFFCILRHTDLGLALGGVTSTVKGVWLTLLLFDPGDQPERGFAARLSFAGQPA